MDKQIALMKKLQKDPNIIAYAHSDEIILIKREYSEDGSAKLVEIAINIDTEKATSRRNLFEDEMRLSDFDAIKKKLTDKTIDDFNMDWRVTRCNVSLDKLENTEIVCLPSVEDEYIEQHEEDDYRTIEDAMRILDEILNEKQKRWFIMSRSDNLSDREIARREGRNQSTVTRGLAVIEKKIKKYLKNN